MIFGVAGLGSLSPGLGSLGTVVTLQKQDFLNVLENDYATFRSQGMCASDAVLATSESLGKKFPSNPPAAAVEALQEFVAKHASEIDKNECGPSRTLSTYVPPDEIATTPGVGPLPVSLLPPASLNVIRMPGSTAAPPPPVPASPPKDASALPPPESTVAGIPWTMVLGFGAVAAVLGLMIWRSRESYERNEYDW